MQDMYVMPYSDQNDAENRLYVQYRRFARRCVMIITGDADVVQNRQKTSDFAITHQLKQTTDVCKRQASGTVPVPVQYGTGTVRWKARNNG